MPERIVRRRWLYLSGRDLYSRPHEYLYLRTGSSAYSRPRAESGGAQRSLFDVRNLWKELCRYEVISVQVFIVKALARVGRTK